jgi:hypothetical protein
MRSTTNPTFAMTPQIGMAPTIAMTLACLLAFGGSARAADEVDWHPPQVIATGGGYQGPWRMNRSEFDYVDAPTAAVDGAGTAYVVWVDQAAKNLRLQRYSADGDAQLPAPVDVSRTPEVFSWLPRIALHPTRSDVVYVLWQEIIFSGGSHGGDILFARSDDGGQTFDQARNLSDDRAGSGKGRVTAEFWHNGSLDLAVAGDGTVYAAWTDYEGDLWISRSRDDGETFSPPEKPLGEDAPGPVLGPSLAVDPEGRVYLAWTMGERADADVHLVVSTDGGETFGEALAVHPGDRHADAPQIAVDQAGTVHLVYGESAEGPMGRYRVRYAQRPREAEAFGDPVDVSAAQLDRFGSTGFPAIALGPAGEVYVSWELFPQPATRPNGLGFARSTDGGQTFSEPAVVPGSIDEADGFNGSLQGLLVRKLAANAAGHLVLVNSTFRPNDGSDVIMYRR